MSLTASLPADTAVVVKASSSSVESLDMKVSSSIGRLTPATALTCSRCCASMTVALAGVPPNMSRKISTPWPLSTLLARGEIDALIGSRRPESFGRHPDVARLFPDHRALERELYQTRKIFPIMHLIVMRRELYERHRWLATSFYDAFIESKRRALARMRYAGSLAVMLPWLQSEIEEIDAVFGGDAWPYGIEPNLPTLQALVRYMVEQHFIASAIPIEELFVPIWGTSAT